MRLPTLLLLTLTAGPASAGEEDYLMIFTADSVPYRPTKAHTFAAVAKVDRQPDGSIRLMDLDSLSWLPLTMKVRPFAFRPEVGRNVPLDETLRTYLATGSRVCMWGPYRVLPEFGDTFRARVVSVEAGFDYKGACLVSRLRVCDCARSVEEMIEPRRRYIGACGYGAAAGSFIMRKFTPWLVEPEQAHPEVAALVGLDEFPIRRRPFGDSTSRWEQLRSSVWTD